MSAVAEVPLTIPDGTVRIIGFIRGQDHIERSGSARRGHNKLRDRQNIRRCRLDRNRVRGRLTQVVGNCQRRDIFPGDRVGVLRILAGRGSAITEIPKVGGDGSIEVSRPGRAECDGQRNIATLRISCRDRDRPLISVRPENAITHTVGIELLD